MGRGDSKCLSSKSFDVSITLKKERGMISVNTKANRLQSALFLGLTLLVAGCDSSDFSYHYLMCQNCSDANGNCYTEQSQCGVGCTTGDHSFTDATAACNTINSYSQNNGCSSNERRQMFQDLKCSGTFTDQ
jgi:hypothetical protein